MKTLQPRLNSTEKFRPHTAQKGSRPQGIINLFASQISFA